MGMKICLPATHRAPLIMLKLGMKEQFKCKQYGQLTTQKIASIPLSQSRNGKY